MSKMCAGSGVCWQTVFVLAAVVVVAGLGTLTRAGGGDQEKPLTDKQKALLKERDSYFTQVSQLAEQGKLAEAILAAEKMLALERQVFGDVHQEIIESLGMLVRLHKGRGDFAAALKTAREKVAVRAKLSGAGHWRTVDARLALADLERWSKLDKQGRADLEDADRFMAEAVRLYRIGKVEAALKPCQQAVELRKKILGETHPDYANNLNNLAFLYKARGDNSRAEPLYLQALQIYKKALGETHPNYATNLHNLAALHEARGDKARAEPLYLQALQIRKQTLGELHLDCANTLNNLAVLYHKRGDFARAEPMLLEALQIKKKALGELHPDFATSLNNLALLYQDRGDHAKAEPLLVQALQIRKQTLGETHPQYANSLHNLAALHRVRGDHTKAEPFYLQALQIYKKTLGEMHPEYASSLHDLASLYDARGDHARAVLLYLQALKIRKQVLSELHPDYASNLHNLAALYHARGDFAKAEPLYLQALRIRKKALSETHPDYANSLNNLAVLYDACGDYAKAEPFHLQALQIRKQALGEMHPQYAQSLNNLAVLYRERGDYAKAESYYLQALQIRKKAPGELHPDYAVSLHNLATLYNIRGDHAKAELLFLQALQIMKKALGEMHPDNANSLNNLALLYSDRRDYAKAEPLLLQALQIRKKALGATHPDYANSLHNLAGLYSDRGDYAKAGILYLQALTISQANLDLAAAGLSERQQLAMADKFRSRLHNYLTNALQGNQPAEQVYAHVLTWKGAVFLRQQQQRALRQLLASTAQPDLLKLYKDLEATSRQLATLAFTLPPPKQQAVWHMQLAKLTEGKERLEAELARRSAAFRQHKEHSQVTPKQLQALLPADAALVDFLEYNHYQPPTKDKKATRERRLVAFVLRPKAPLQLVELGPAVAIDKAIATWRSTIKQATPPPGVAGNLRKLVWQPLVPHLKGVQVVLVAPDGVLTRLPLAALPGDKPGTYLIEDLAIGVIPVPQLLPELLTPPKDKTQGKGKELVPSLLVVGDVDFGAAPGTPEAGATDLAAPRSALPGGLLEWAQLPSTRGEMLAIRDSFEKRHPKGRVTLLREDGATEEALRQQAPKHRWLHLATHGFFAPEQLQSALAPRSRSVDADGMGLLDRQGVSGFHPGLLSGLVLAGTNQPIKPGQDDGILTALEVASLDLSGVDLAVLSACETGLGKTAGGEGVLGLQRAFQVAGAKTTVASLWTVPDNATRELMERFYGHLLDRKQPLNKLEALRQAQLYLLREGPKRGLTFKDEMAPLGPVLRSPPYFWAAFVLSGDWR